MGCWVVPAVAAELWGIPLSQVMDCIQNGVLFWKSDEGFVLVDADAKGAALVRKATPKAQRPPTYTPIVTQTELQALLDEDDQPALAPSQPPAIESPAMESAAVEAAPATLESEPPVDTEAFDWRPARRQAAQLRRPPGWRQ